MLKRKVILLSLISIFFLNCKRETKNDELKTDTTVKPINNPVIVDTHNASNSLDWQGTYKGVVPCADCEGIATTIILNDDMTYVITTTYLGKGEEISTEKKDNFSWEADGLRICLSGIINGADRYLVGENKLFQLDSTGKRIFGAHPEKYQLLKQN